MPASPSLDLVRLRELLADEPLWRQIDWVASTGSTNRDLAEAAREGSASGMALVAEEQTAGRGRFERRWESPSGACVAISLMVRPARGPLDWGWLSLLAGMAVATGIERACGVSSESGRVQLKWPNDVLVDGRKVCGILSERVVSAGLVDAAVVGIGINISLDADELPVPHATSLRLAGLAEDKTKVVAEVLREFAQLLRAWELTGEVREAYSSRCSSIGSALRVMVDEHTSIEGVGIGVDADGALVVRTDQGDRSFNAGDVFHLRRQD